MRRPSPPRRPAGTPTTATRRAVLAAALGLPAALLTACEPPVALPGGGSDEPRATDADAGTVDDAVAAVRSARSVVAGATQAQPTLGAALAPLVALHDAQLDALQAAPEPSPGSPSATGPATAPTAPPDPTTALAEVRAAGTTLADRLADLAVAAQSGALARLLAALAAGTDQALLTLPAETS